MYKPKSRKEIVHFLGVEDGLNSSSPEVVKLCNAAIKRAETIETKYHSELVRGIYSYGLCGDFDNRQGSLENLNEYELIEVERYYEGVVLYRLKERKYEKLFEQKEKVL